MKAMVLKEFNSPLVLEDVPIPEYGPDEILIKNKVSSVCGTDIKITTGKISTVPLPLIPGHEITGEIVGVGSNVKHLKLGDRVCFNIYLTCGYCKNCLDGRPTVCMNTIRRLGFEINGGFAEYMVGPAANAVKIPDGVSYRHAAVTPDAIGVSVHAYRDRVKIKEGDNLLILGAGGLGLHGMQVAKALGAVISVADIDDSKLEKAKELGAVHTFNTTKVDLVQACKEVTGGYGMDIVADYCGIPATNSIGIKCTRMGGTMLFVGYAPGTQFLAESHDIAMSELTLIGSRAMTNENIAEALDMVAKGLVKPQIDAEFPLEAANEVLDRLKKGQFVSRGILIVDETSDK